MTRAMVNMVKSTVLPTLNNIMCSGKPPSGREMEYWCGGVDWSRQSIGSSDLTTANKEHFDTFRVWLAYYLAN